MRGQAHHGVRSHHLLALVLTARRNGGLWIEGLRFFISETVIQQPRGSLLDLASLPTNSGQCPHQLEASAGKRGFNTASSGAQMPSAGQGAPGLRWGLRPISSSPLQVHYKGQVWFKLS